jgi:hypothetical protein
MPYTHRDLEAAYDAMVECALWSSTAEFWEPNTDEVSIPCDELHDESHIAPELLTEWRDDLRAFMDDNEADLADMNLSQIGHDFWLTRNRHGAGFWDRGLGERGRRLTDAAHVYGETDPQLYWRYDDNGEQVPA